MRSTSPTPAACGSSVRVPRGAQAAHILRDGLDRGFDLAFSNELRIDHSVTCPIITLRPQADLPIVPVYTNIFAPPLPQPKRFVDLGRSLRSFVESWDSDKRVAIIGTGFGGLGVAARLRQAGIDTFTVFEKADAVGGTWRSR